MRESGPEVVPNAHRGLAEEFRSVRRALHSRCRGGERFPGAWTAGALGHAHVAGGLALRSAFIVGDESVAPELLDEEWRGLVDVGDFVGEEEGLGVFFPDG